MRRRAITVIVDTLAAGAFITFLFAVFCVVCFMAGAFLIAGTGMVLWSDLLEVL